MAQYWCPRLLNRGVHWMQVYCCRSEWAWRELTKAALESGRGHIGAWKKFLRNERRNCGSGKIKGARNCGYARLENLACSVFHVFSRVEKCSEVRFSRLCKLLFTLVAGFLRFCYSYCCVVSEPRRQKHQPYRNKEVSRSKALATDREPSQFSKFYCLLTVNIKALKTSFVEVNEL